MNILRTTAMTLGLLLAFETATRAADGGSFNAVAFADLPPGTTVTVRALDNSDENLALQRVFESELTAQGYIVSQNAPLIFSFETSDDIGAYSSGDRRSILELQGTTGTSHADQDTQVRLNLFDSRRGGIFNEGRDDRTNVVTPASFRIDTAINDSRDGKRLWQAWTIASPQSGGRADAARIMVPIIVAALGKTVKESSFTLP